MQQTFVYYVTNLNDSGNNSLRDAIKFANKNILLITHIIIKVHGTVILKKSLPPINATVFIDGVTELNYPLFEINCNGHDVIITDDLDNTTNIT